MKKAVLRLTIILCALLPKLASGQTFSTQYDTVYASVSGASTVYDYLTNNQPDSIAITWKVIACDFPNDWFGSAAFGICDNYNCYGNTNNMLWNGTTGQSHTSAMYPPGGNGPFDLQLTFTSVSAGTHYITVNLANGATSKNVTFIVSKHASSVNNVTNNDEVTLYPNPAPGSVNILYDANAGIKLAAVYNMIGKVMLVNKVSGNSANINLENVPAGTYFIRLIDGNGAVVATRKFTHQQ